MKKIDNETMLDMACEKYVEILSNAVRKGYTKDPLDVVSLFLGLGIAQNVMYQKLVEANRFDLLIWDAARLKQSLRVEQE